MKQIKNMLKRNWRKASKLFMGSWLLSFGLQYAHAQVNLAPGIDNVKTIAIQVGQVVGIVVSVLGFGRAAYKFAQGDGDSTTSLLMGIVGAAVAAVAMQAG